MDLLCASSNRSLHLCIGACTGQRPNHPLTKSASKVLRLAASPSPRTGRTTADTCLPASQCNHARTQASTQASGQAHTHACVTCVQGETWAVPRQGHHSSVQWQADCCDGV